MTGRRLFPENSACSDYQCDGQANVFKTRWLLSSHLRIDSQPSAHIGATWPSRRKAWRAPVFVKPIFAEGASRPFRRSATPNYTCCRLRRAGDGCSDYRDNPDRNRQNRSIRISRCFRDADARHRTCTRCHKPAIRATGAHSSIFAFQCGCRSGCRIAHHSGMTFVRDPAATSYALQVRWPSP